jgi:hypothetical protein
VIPCFLREVDENCVLVEYHAARSSNSLPAFRDNLTVPFSRVKNTITLEAWPWKMGKISCPETSVRNYRSSLRKTPEEHSSHLLRGGSLNSHIVRLYGEEILRHLQTFELLSVWILDPWNWDQIGCPETSVWNYHCLLRNTPRRVQFSVSVLMLFVFSLTQLLYEHGN